MLRGQRHINRLTIGCSLGLDFKCDSDISSFKGGRDSLQFNSSYIDLLRDFCVTAVLFLEVERGCSGFKFCDVSKFLYRFHGGTTPTLGCEYGPADQLCGSLTKL